MVLVCQKNERQRKVKRRHTPVFIALYVSLAFGLLTCCINAVNNDSTSSSETDGRSEGTGRDSTEKPTSPVTRVFNLGSGTGLLTKECDLRLDETAVIESINRSCGCTEIGLKEGQTLSPGLGKSVRNRIDGFGINGSLHLHA